ncbi:MAG: cytochrome C oxidase subunit IV family protein [Chitinophagaceae bacterium]
MSAQSTSADITLHHDPPGTTRRIWKTFWILLVVTTIETCLGLAIHFMHMEGGLALMTKIVIIILTLLKAFYIVSIFMHLGDEIRNFIMTIIVPLMLFIWFIVAFLWDGDSWKTMRNTDAGSRPDTEKVEKEKAAKEKGEKD